MEQEWLRYGGLGVVIAGSWIVIRILWHEIQKLRQEHKAERDEWRETIEKQFDDSNERDDEHKDLLKEIKGLLHRNNNNRR